jgi:hypothetical protein
MIRIVSHGTTGAKVSKKSSPLISRSPLAQNLALSLQMIPSGDHLHLNAHVDGVMCIQTFFVTTSHGSFLTKVSTSFLAACQYPSLSGPNIA